MAWELPGFKLPGKRAAADLSALQFRFVVDNASGFIAQSTTIGGVVVGVLQNKPGNNEAAEVMVTGVSKVVAGAAITEGTAVTSDAVGRAAVPAAGNYRVGIALSSAAAAGEVIPVLLLHMGNA